MASCIIFCAGGFDALAEPVGKGDYILAADGGLTHLQTLGLTPDEALGDFDSLGYTPAGATVFPVEKDDPDSMLAVRRGLTLGYSRFVLYGSLDGPRLDHTVANFQTLQYLADHGAKGYLIGARQIATVVKDGALQFPAEAKGIFSVFCMGAPAGEVTISGAKYTLDNGTLHSGLPLGVSNHFTGKPVTVRVSKGSLLVIYERKNGLIG